MKMYFNLIDWDMGLHKKEKKRSGNAGLEEHKQSIKRSIQTSLTILK